MDLHLHTPASADYQEENVSYLDILRQADLRGLDVIAFTDHNTVKGYSTMLAEIEQLQRLEALKRAEPAEQTRLEEYRRLLDKILILPGFEFTATFGFHVLGIFPPQTPVRLLEHVLLNLHIPIDTLEEGSSNVGASSDVLTAYRVIRNNGGLVIAAHANSTHGVAMKGLDFGGQTRIAYTQDESLHALEVTDLEKRGRYNTARFFDGTKPGYPRRMRCIQGSDAHRLVMNPSRHKDLGVGDRITEILLPELSFAAIKEVFESNDFALTRPYRSSTHAPFDPVQAAQEEGESIIQAFHLSAARKGGQLTRIIEDVCAFANTNGGTIYIGFSADSKARPVGVAKPNIAIETLLAEIDKLISPALQVDIDTLTSQGQTIIRIQVPRGEKVPYVINDNLIYIRDESDTTLAVRDEIVRLVMRGLENRSSSRPLANHQAEAANHHPSHTPEGHSKAESIKPADSQSPLTGVEVVGTEKRRGTQYHMMRDLRNNNTIHNVTRSSARRLWHYAIMETENKTFDEKKVTWNERGDMGLIKRYQKAGATRYDLAHRTKDKNAKPIIRIYYGVTEDGMQGPWAEFISDEEAPEEL